MSHGLCLQSSDSLLARIASVCIWVFVEDRALCHMCGSLPEVQPPALLSYGWRIKQKETSTWGFLYTRAPALLKMINAAVENIGN
jgi:hypothetical protein